jgi:hypothetical protein
MNVGQSLFYILGYQDYGYYEIMAITIAARWERWLRAFELFAEGKGITNHGQKKALLLHTAGMSVQDIFFTLPEETEGMNVFVKAINALNRHFKPQANVPYERLVFSRNETVRTRDSRTLYNKINTKGSYL